ASVGSVLICRPDLASVRSFLTKYTGPVRGSLSSGVLAVAVPTIEPAGHCGIVFWPSANSHNAWALSGSSASDSGSVTVAFFRFALPLAGSVRLAARAGCLLSVVWPLPLRFSDNFGATDKSPQPPTCNLDATSAVAPPEALALPVTCIGSHEVGETMN